MICYFCKSELIGEEGNMICSNLICGAYQVDTSKEGYEKKITKKEREERQ